MEVKNWKECLSAIRACINFVSVEADSDTSGAAEVQDYLTDAEAAVEDVLIGQGEENP